jgi:hypothetical protein
MVMSVALVEVSTGATLTVQKDGSGDYVVIQAALDAAADGDTILIGPGEYLEETVYRPAGWGYDIRAYGRAKSDDLTIIGAGVGVTVIGPATFVNDPQYFNPKGIYYIDQGGLSVRDLTIQNCREGIYAWGTLFVDACEFESNSTGVVWWTVGPGGWVKNSEFRGADQFGVYPYGISLIGPGSDILVQDCVLDHSTLLAENITNSSVRSCVVSNGISGVVVVGNTSLLLDKVSMAEIAVGVNFDTPGGRCEIRESTISGYWAAIWDFGGSYFNVDSSTLIGGDRGVFLASHNPGASVINNCDLIKGTGPVVVCSTTSTPVTLDLTNNYWGTASVDSIAAWIIDINDDPAVKATVLYNPFSPTSVPVQKKSLGSVKSMFRDATR